MWLERCWGQAVSFMAELEVGGGGSVRAGGKKLRGVGPDRAWKQSHWPGISGIA